MEVRLKKKIRVIIYVMSAILLVFLMVGTMGTRLFWSLF